MTMPLTIDNRAQLRRWVLSSALVVAAHGAIAAAVLTWRIVIVPLNVPAPPAAGPLLIDLAPVAPMSGSAQPAAPPTAPLGGTKDSRAAQPNTMSAAVGERGAPGASANDRSPIGGEGAQQTPQTAAGMNAATAPAQSRPSEAQQSTKAITASGGGGAVQQAAPGHGLGRTTAMSPATTSPTASAPSLTLRVNPGPLDTSNTVVPPLHGRKPTGVMALPGFGALHSLQLPGERDGGRNSGAGSVRGTNDRTTAIRIPGARIPGPYGQNSARADELAKGPRASEGIRTAIGSPASASSGVVVRPGGEVRSALGSAAATGLGGAAASAPDRIATNAIGMTIHTHVGRVGEFKADPITRTPAAMGGAVINGREMTRPGMRNAAIGGPARVALPGVLSGSSFLPRRR